LEDTLKAFIQTSSKIIQELNQSTQELKNATMSNSQTIQDWVQDDSTNGGEHYPIAHIDDLDGRVNQLMEARYYTSMINEDKASDSCQMHVPAATILRGEITAL